VNASSAGTQRQVEKQERTQEKFYRWFARGGQIEQRSIRMMLLSTAAARRLGIATPSLSNGELPSAVFAGSVREGPNTERSAAP
jgi:hypothetical protein